MSLKEGLPFYIAGIFLDNNRNPIFVVFFSRILYLRSVFILVAAGLVLYLGWILHFDKDNKEFDNGSRGRRRIFLEKPPNPS